MSKKLRMRRIKLILLSLFFLASVVLANNDHGITHFERELFTPQIFNHFGIGKDRFQSLTSDQKNNLLEARKALMLFLVAIQNPDSDFSKFLSQEFLDQYKTRQEFLSDLIAPETEILVSAISDFEFQQNETIILKHYVVIFSEGDLSIRENSVHLREFDSVWKITDICKNPEMLVSPKNN